MGQKIVKIGENEVLVTPFRDAKSAVAESVVSILDEANAVHYGQDKIDERRDYYLAQKEYWRKVDIVKKLQEVDSNLELLDLIEAELKRGI
jgi:hypothetical protein